MPVPDCLCSLTPSASSFDVEKLAVGVASDSQIFFRAPICYRAHRAVIFATAGLSCSVGWGNIKRFFGCGAKVCEKQSRQSNCNVYFSFTMGSGAKPPDAGEFSRIFVLNLLQSVTLSYRKKIGRARLLLAPLIIFFWGGGTAAPRLCPLVMYVDNSVCDWLNR